MNTTQPIFRMAAVAACLVAWAAASVHAAPPPPPPFMEQLAAHGEWRHADDLGWYWRPQEADRQPDWRPYVSGGHWHWNGETWQWASDHAWGAVVFRHGRWANLPDRGWRWFPGLESSPAWVHWVRADGFWGWVPLPPTPEEFPDVRREFTPRPDDFVFVPEGRLTERFLDPIVVAGTEPGAPPRQGPPPVAVQPPVAAQQPVFAQQPVYVVPTYVQSPVVVREHMMVGSAVSWHWHQSSCSYCRSRCGGYCTSARRGSSSVRSRPVPSHDRRTRLHPAPSHDRRTRLEPIPTRTPTPRPYHVPVSTRPDTRTVPIRSGNPVGPSIHRPPPAPSSGSRRAQGVRDFLNNR